MATWINSIDSIVDTIQSNLNTLKQSITQKQTPEEKSDLKINVFNLLRNIKWKLSPNEQSEIKLIMDDIKTKEVSWNHIDKINKFFDKVKSSEITSIDINKLKDIHDNLSQIKWQLSGLKASIDTQAQTLKENILKVSKIWLPNFMHKMLKNILTKLEANAQKKNKPAGSNWEKLMSFWWLDDIWFQAQLFMIYAFGPKWLKELIENYKKLLEGKETETKNENNTNEVDKDKEAMKKLVEREKFRSTTNIFIKFSIDKKNNNRDDIPDIVLREEFNKIKYWDLKEIYDWFTFNKYIWISKKLWLEPYTDKKLYQTINMFFDKKSKWKKIIDEIYENKNIDDMTIKEIMLWLTDDLFVFDWIWFTNPTDILTAWAAFDFQKSPDWKDIWSVLLDKTEKVWITTNMISYAISSRIKIDNNANSKLQWQDNLNSIEKEKFEEIIQFWQVIQEEISKNNQIHLNNSSAKNIKNTPLSLIDVIKLYTLCGNKYDAKNKKLEFNTLNSFQKTYFYFCLASILDPFAQWEYTAELFGNIVEEQNTTIPQDVLDLIKDIVDKWLDSISENLQITAKKLAWAFWKKPEIWVTLALAMYFFPYAKRASLHRRITDKYGNKA